MNKLKIAHKLFRLKANGEITSLFINKGVELKTGQWLNAECHPTKGYMIRPFWHCTGKPEAPHLSEKNRIWREVIIGDFIEIQRPSSQGGKWYLANQMMIL